MSERETVMLLLLGYLTLCAAFFAAVFTGKHIGLGLNALLLSQVIALVLMLKVSRSQR